MEEHAHSRILRLGPYNAFFHWLNVLCVLGLIGV